MFSLRGSWLSRTQRRIPPPLGVEPLEQRLAPTTGLSYSIVLVTDSASSPPPANVSRLELGNTVSAGVPQGGQTVQYALTIPASGRLTLTSAPGPGSLSAPHVVLQEVSGRLLLDSSGGSNMVVLLQPGEETYLLTVEGGAGGYQLDTRFDALFPLASRRESDRAAAARDDNHPVLAALVLAYAGNLNLGGGRLLSALGELMGAPPSPVVPLGASLVGTALMPASVKPASPPMNPSATVSAITSQSALAYLPKRPASGDALGFPAFNPMAKKPAGKDRPSSFALSPFTPSGLDIVPVPVPSGLEEKLADLFGDPSPDPRDGSSSGALGVGADREYVPIRDAVQHMLQESSTFSHTDPNLSWDRCPLSPTESGPPQTITDAIFSAGTPLDPPSEDDPEGPAIPSATRSTLALLAVSVGLAGRQQRAVSRDAQRSALPPRSAARRD